MSLSVQTNIEAFDAHRNLVNTSNMLSESMQKLSSGYRINKAADDGAGFAVDSSIFSFSGSTINLSAIDAAIENVSTDRATFGAVQNRLQHTLNNLGNYQENLSAAESSIKDVDMAAEMVNFTKLQVLQQAGMSVLGQANQSSQSVLSLLRG